MIEEIKLKYNLLNLHLRRILNKEYINKFKILNMNVIKL